MVHDLASMAACPTMLRVERDTERTDDTHPVPTSDLETAKAATSRAVWRIQLRYVALAVSLNVCVAAVVVAYDIYNDRENTRSFLIETASYAAHTVRVLQERGASPREVIDQASDLTSCEMALINEAGRVFYASDGQLGRVAMSRGWPTATTPVDEAVLFVDSSLGPLSGLWWLSRYDERFRLLIIVHRLPEDEGRVQYMTFAAGITGAGVLVTLVIMLLASNWMVRRPLVQKIDALTDALVHDVHRRRDAEKRANEAREQAERLLRFRNNLLDASDEVAIVATGPSGRIELVNRVAERILGYPTGELVGKKTLDELMGVLQPPVDDAPRDTLRPFLARADGEQAIIDAAGNRRLVQITTSPIRDPEGREAGTLTIFMDVTEQRRVEAELKSKQMQIIQSSRMATLGEMAAGVAHELNQPLNNIGLLAARLIRRVQKSDVLEGEGLAFVGDKLGSIQDQVNRAAKIIDHLRVFGRADPAPLSAFDVGTAIHGSLELLGEQLRLHDIGLEIDVAEGLPKVVGDPSRLEQVLINLIVNARFALDEDSERRAAVGEPSRPKRLGIRAYADQTPSGRRRVLIEVSDNGPGMSEEVASRVFEPFFTTKEVGKGTGLGLSISYGIVREFGGTLSVDSAEGRGSTFTITLRCADDAGDS